MKKLKLVLSILLFAIAATAQTTFNQSVTVQPSDNFSGGITVRLPNGSFVGPLTLVNGSSNLLTVDKVGYVQMPGGGNVGGILTVNQIAVGDRSVSLVGWPGSLTATNASSPNAYAAFKAAGYSAGAAVGLTTNLNVVIAGSGTNQLQYSTNQLQFVGGILTGVVPQ